MLDWGTLVERLLDVGSDVRLASSPYAAERRGTDVVAFVRRRVPTAADAEQVSVNRISAWIVSGLAIAGALLMTWIVLFGLGQTTLAIGDFWSEMMAATFQSLKWLLVPAAVVALGVAVARQRRRPREVVFDAAAREVRFLPGHALPFANVDVHAFKWQDVSGEAPRERYQVYLRAEGRRFTLVETASFDDARELADELRSVLTAKPLPVPSDGPRERP